MGGLKIPAVDSSSKPAIVPDHYKMGDRIQLGLSQLGDGFYPFKGTMEFEGEQKSIISLNGEVISGSGLQVLIRDYIALIDGIILSDKNKAQFTPANTIPLAVTVGVNYIVLKAKIVIGSDGFNRPDFDKGEFEIQTSIPENDSGKILVAKLNIPAETTQVDASMIDNSVKDYLKDVDYLDSNIQDAHEYIEQLFSSVLNNYSNIQNHENRLIGLETKPTGIVTKSKKLVKADWDAGASSNVDLREDGSAALTLVETVSTLLKRTFNDDAFESEGDIVPAVYGNRNAWTSGDVWFADQKYHVASDSQIYEKFNWKKPTPLIVMSSNILEWKIKFFYPTPGDSWVGRILRSFVVWRSPKVEKRLYLGITEDGVVDAVCTGTDNLGGAFSFGFSTPSDMSAYYGKEVEATVALKDGVATLTITDGVTPLVIEEVFQELNISSDVKSVDWSTIKVFGDPIHVDEISINGAVTLAYSTPGVAQSNELDSVDPMRTLAAISKSNIPANTAITLEVTKDGGTLWEALPLVGSKDYTPLITGPDVRVRYTLTTTDPTKTPILESSTVGTDNSVAQADMLLKANKGESITSGDAPTQGGSYVQADVQAIATLANELKAKLDAMNV